jgi:ribose transport system substrate-binding protein
MQQRMSWRRRPQWRAIAAAALCIPLLALAACSTSGTPSSSTSGSSSSTSGAYAAKAAAAVKSFPTKYAGPTDAVKSVPSTFKIALISCAKVLSGCQAPTDGAAAAAKALGWDVREYDGGGTGQAQNAAILNAITWGAQAIGTYSIDGNLIQQGLAAAKSAGVTMFSGDNGIDTPNPVIPTPAGKIGFAFDVSVDWGSLGKAAADWIINNSGEKANLVVFQDKEYPGSLAEEAGLVKEFKTCTTCTLQPLFQFTSTDTTVPADTVSYLRQHPDVNYVWSAFDPAAVGQVQAIAQAGLNKVKLVSTIGAQQNLDLIRSNRIQVADAAYDNVYLGYASIDQFLRFKAGQSLSEPKGENVPYVVLDKTNLTDPGKDWVAPFNYISEFKTLWKLK